jgi:hypothetical protein
MFHRIFRIILFIFNKKRDSERAARVSEGAVARNLEMISCTVIDNPQRGRLVLDTVINTAIWRSRCGKGSSAPQNTRQTYVYLQPHHLHQHLLS